MQFKLALVTVALATLAVASPTPSAEGNCSTGTMQCCEKTETAAKAKKDHALVELLDRGGIKTKDITGTVGFGCHSNKGHSCHSQTVCCTESSGGGIISVGCVPLQTR